MPVYPMYFQPLSFQQNNPMLTGLQAGSNVVGSNLQNQMRTMQNQILQAQVPYAPQMAQAQLANAQAQAPYLQAQTSAIPSEIQQRLAEAGLMGTETGKNQFLLNNPALMLPGMPGQMAGAYMLPSMMSQSSPPPVNANQNAPQQSSNIPADIARPQQLTNQMPAGLPLANNNYPVLPGGLTPQQGNNIATQLSNASGTPAPQSTGNSLADQMMRMMFLPQQKDMAQMQYYQSRANPFNNLTPDMKNYDLAQGVSFGYTPDQVANQMMQGKSLTDLAAAKGFDSEQSSWPDPTYAPTGAMRSLINRRQSSLAELNTLGPQLTQALAPYSQRIANYSPSQIASAISGDNPDQQARFLAAKALMPEYSSLRLKVMQGQVGIEAIKEVQNASMGNIKSFQALVNPDVYTKANQYMDQWLNQATGAANRVSSTGKMPDSQSLSNALNNQSKVLNGVTYQNINGQWYQQ